MNVLITNSEIYSQMQNMGYRIEIVEEDESKYVWFHSKYCKNPYKITHCYSLDWADNTIINDVIPWLMHWADVQVVAKVEHRT